MYHVNAHVQRVLRAGALALSMCAPALAIGCAQSANEKAMSLARQHRETEAIATLQARLAEHPEDLAARRLLVRMLAFAGDIEGARREVLELTKRMPKGDPTPWIELGHAYELQHQYDDALHAYDAAAEIAPESPAGPLEGGMRCARWGEIEAAKPRLEEAIRRGARDAGTWHALGLVRVHLKDFDGAEQAYRAGVAADPRAAENLLGLATVAMLRSDAPRALEAYDALLARRPRYAAAELGRAWALAKLGRREEAAKALDRAEELGAPTANVAKQRAALAAALPPAGRDARDPAPNQ